MDDLISRLAVMHALEKCHKQCCREDDCGDEWIHYETTVNELECIPSAQSEQKTGYWVSQKCGGYCCSECGRYALDEVDGNFIHVAFKSNFCPYCGIDMRGEKDV